MMNLGSLLLYALLGLAVSLATAWMVVRQQFESFGVDDAREMHRKHHHRAVSRLGGLALALAFVVAAGLLISSNSRGGEWWPVVWVTLSYFLLGFVDDIVPLGAKIKLLGQIAIAILAYHGGLRIELLSSIDGGASWSLGGASLLVTVAWLIALPNIINLIDGMDGLAAGIGLFVFGVIGIMTMHGGNPVAAGLSFAMVGAHLGFLVFNFPPARVYLGDGGAYFLGAAIATISMNCSHKGSVAAIFMVVVIALGLPILDTLFAIIRRGLRGLPLFHADAHHVHHRLQRLGFSKRTSLFLMYGVCLFFCMVGLSVFWSRGVTLPIAAAGIFLAALMGAKQLGFVHQWSGFRSQVFRAAGRRRAVRRAHICGQFLVQELEHCADDKEFWRLFNGTAERLGFVVFHDSFRPIRRQVSSHELSEMITETPGNPTLALYYPARLEHACNWWVVAECLYPAYVQAVVRFREKVGDDSSLGMISARVLQ